VGQPVSDAPFRWWWSEVLGDERRRYATDCGLTITEMLRRHGVVGKFLEYYGTGAGFGIGGPATIANMSPEYGALANFPFV